MRLSPNAGRAQRLMMWTEAWSAAEAWSATGPVLQAKQQPFSLSLSQDSDEGVRGGDRPPLLKGISLFDRKHQN